VRLEARLHLLRLQVQGPQDLDTHALGEVVGQAGGEYRLAGTGTQVVENLFVR
jgi:hypothetical protein